MKDKLIAGGIIVSLLLGGFAYFSGGDKGRDGRDGRDGLAAISGPDVFNHMNFRAGFQGGGTVNSTTSPDSISTYTLTESEFGGDISYFNWLANRNITLTTMASTAMAFLGNVAGDERSYWFFSATSTAAATITFAAGTGVDLQDNEDSADLDLLGGDLIKLTFIRKVDTDVLLVLDEYTEAD